jgi:hypothetical protein
VSVSRSECSCNKDGVSRGGGGAGSGAKGPEERGGGGRGREVKSWGRLRVAGDEHDGDNGAARQTHTH